jgi:zinc-ribbon domain
MTTKSIVLTVILVCVGLFVAAIALCVGVLFLGYRTADADLSPKIDEVFAAINDGTLAEKYATATTPEFQQVMTKEQFIELGAMIKAKLGPLKSKSMTQFNIRQLNADSFADVAYDATFEQGTGAVQARFRKVDGNWRLVSFRVNSPVFLQDLATKPCPHCGQPVPASAKFCPACGKPVAEQTKTDAKETAEKP